eukprot:gnl/MRDRNA2_/MRDRNA2_276202_c0_seq1.p1 gnl/MRDRNA2_/MRDRNA2_276202_c0~~gnl/MRDRNA2_/MRDRNA2_276202_c0_seq1.p1  ORF type:complete len:184 (+),score=9.74 gnl/MRDRNA2_/MRDRNA2_276202_c0_seq1:195-746(+)
MTSLTRTSHCITRHDVPLHSVCFHLIKQYQRLLSLFLLSATAHGHIEARIIWQGSLPTHLHQDSQSLIVLSTFVAGSHGRIVAVCVRLAPFMKYGLQELKRALSLTALLKCADCSTITLDVRCFPSLTFSEKLQCELPQLLCFGTGRDGGAVTDCLGQDSLMLHEPQESKGMKSLTCSLASTD